jgi:hypothetical protein
MKQTASVNECAVCAIVPRIRNAGSWPVFTGNLDDSAPHNAAKRGTYRDFHRLDPLTPSQHYSPGFSNNFSNSLNRECKTNALCALKGIAVVPPIAKEKEAI